MRTLTTTINEAGEVVSAIIADSTERSQVLWTSDTSNARLSIHLREVVETSEGQDYSQQRLQVILRWEVPYGTDEYGEEVEEDIKEKALWEGFFFIDHAHKQALLADNFRAARSVYNRFGAFYSTMGDNPTDDEVRRFVAPT